MPTGRPFLRRACLCGHLLALALLLAGSPARADDYAEVNRLIRAGQATQALSTADRYLAGNPRDPQMQFLRAVALGEGGRTADAIEAYTRMTQDYPELPEPYNNLAVLLAGQNELDKARILLETAVRARPDYATAYENLGDVLVRLAARAWARAGQLDPGLAAVAPKLEAVRSLTGLAPSPAALPAPRIAPASPVRQAPADRRLRPGLNR